jgi:hypothetical protein
VGLDVGTHVGAWTLSSDAFCAIQASAFSAAHHQLLSVHHEHVLAHRAYNYVSENRHGLSDVLRRLPGPLAGALDAIIAAKRIDVRTQSRLLMICA